MKIHLTNPDTLVTSFGLVQHAINEKVNSTVNSAKHIYINYPAYLTLALSKLKSYLSFIISQAFKDNTISETEMDFLLITITGSFLSARKEISRIANRFTKFYRS